MIIAAVPARMVRVSPRSQLDVAMGGLGHALAPVTMTTE